MVPINSSPNHDAEKAVLPAIALAESLARAYAESGGNVVDLFAAFVGVVVEKDKKLGIAALNAADAFLSKRPPQACASSTRR